MKKQRLLQLIFILLLLTSTVVTAVEPETGVNFETVRLVSSGPNLLLAGDSGFIQTAPAPNVSFLECRIKGEALQLESQETRRPAAGFFFRFNTVKSGEAEVTLRFAGQGTGPAFPALQRYTVQVFSIPEFTRVPLVKIKESPNAFYGKFILLEGDGRGWGLPNQAREIWGTRLTKSDWVLEDESGAAYITGMIVMEPVKIKLVAEVRRAGAKGWAIWGNRLLK